ncbi:putative ribosome-binding factor A, mitochondrial [Polymixia lowei]
MFPCFRTRLLLRQQYVNVGTLRAGRWEDLGCVTAACRPLAGQGSLLLVPGPRSVHTAAVCRAKNLLKRFLNKSKKKIWYETPPQTPSTVRPPKKRDQEDSHRCKILNSLLFKAVSDLLISAQLSHDLQKYSPEISKVSLAPDFSSCCVFWKSSGESERDQLIQKVLDKNSPLIRYLIMSQQIMGGVPPLVFLRDKQHAAMVEVDRLLQQIESPTESPDPPEEDPSSNDRYGSADMAGGGAISGSVQPVLFGVDHEILNRQIAEWQQTKQSKGEGLGHSPPTELTQEQLTVLAEYRKQQIINKKKKKAPPVHDDVTPKEFLLKQHDVTPQWQGQAQGQEEPEEGRAFKQEEAQLRELMSQEDKIL